MAECTIKVIDWPEKNNDNHDFAAKHPDALKVTGKKDLTKKVLQKMKKDNCTCIKKLIILGHGAPGDISVGSGRESLKCKYINDNESDWKKDLKGLQNKFCKNGTVVLFGCNTGAGKKGADKLHKLARFFGVTLKGTNRPVYASEDPETNSPVTATPDEKPSPQGPNSTGKKKKKTKSGTKLPDPKTVEAMAIYVANESYWSRKPKKIEFTIEDKKPIHLLLRGIDYRNEYEGEGLKAKYDAEVFLLTEDRRIHTFHVILDWSAVEIASGETRSVFDLKSSVGKMYKKHAINPKPRKTSQSHSY